MLKSTTPIIVTSVIVLFLLSNISQALTLKVVREFSHLESIAIDSASPNISTNKQNATKAQNKIELPADFEYPNGIAQAEDGTIYVGSVTSGRILQIAPNSQVSTFFAGGE